MHKQMIVFLLAICIILSFTACKQKSPPISGTSDFPITINSINIERKPASVVVTASFIADIICDIDQHSVIVGVPQDYDAQALPNAQIIGNSSSPSINAIIEIKPDLVFTQQAFSVRDLQTLNDAGIQVIVIERATTASGLSDLYQSIAMSLLGRTEGARIANTKIQPVYTTFKDFSNNVPVPRKNYLYITNTDGMVATQDTLENSILSQSGKNVVDASYTKYTVDAEVLKTYQPDLVIINESVDISIIKENECFKDMEAIQNDAIIQIDGSAFSNQVCDGIIQIAYTVANQFYPDVFQISTAIKDNQ